MDGKLMRKLLFALLMLAFLIPLVLFIIGTFSSFPDNSPRVRVFLADENRIVSLTVEDYLVGVVAAEMPAAFHSEALKAQVVAARTYVLKRINYSGKGINESHPKAHVCTRPEHCQGWLADEDMKRKWGRWGYWKYRAKILTAVRETTGQVITYQRELIDPVYHSTCGGKKENAEDIWTYALPYLKSVSCNWDRESPKYQGKALVSFQQLREKTGADLEVYPVSGFYSGPLLQVSEKTAGGRIKSIKVGNTVLTGTEFRRRLGLNSTNFTWEFKDQGVEFSTTGYGHGVGLCQYGAQGMAQEGKSAQEIIKHYYHGVRIEKFY
ncbi:MAG: stage II sporulation protein D [Clostridia bacterium]|nr:stage II sporulation protein D [Clostridia bacterium]